ncbi:Calcium-binding component of the spindle pole body (SPB) half-bridge [Exophiala xenobiotica]|nr:Calcium-binding component of the spindle pole body (SPB) half-bridge [Exophiala xenobiotica]
MSQANPSFPGRSVYASSSKLPDRTGSKPPGLAAPSQTYTQSTFGRRPEQAYQFGQSTATHAQHGGQGVRQSMEKEPNALSELSEEQRDEINEAFSLFDLDRDRHLDYQEMRIALRSLGFTVPRPEVSQIMHAHGVPKPQFKRGPPGKGQTAYHSSQLLLPQNAFQRVAAQKVFERDPSEEVERALLLFDPDQRGYIEVEDIRRVARELGETGLEDDEIHAMVEEFDYDGTGSVAKEAFYTICLQ